MGTIDIQIACVLLVTIIYNALPFGKIRTYPLALGPRGRQFESGQPDHLKSRTYRSGRSFTAFYKTALLHAVTHRAPPFYLPHLCNSCELLIQRIFSLDSASVRTSIAHPSFAGGAA